MTKTDRINMTKKDIQTEVGDLIHIVSLTLGGVCYKYLNDISDDKPKSHKLYLDMLGLDAQKVADRLVDSIIYTIQRNHEKQHHELKDETLNFYIEKLLDNHIDERTITRETQDIRAYAFKTDNEELKSLLNKISFRTYKSNLNFATKYNNRLNELKSK